MTRSDPNAPYECTPAGPMRAQDALGVSRKTTLNGVNVDTQFVSDLARKLARAVPGAGADLDVMRADLERNFRGLLDGAFDRMELVTREEFDVQRRVLERTREKLARLEAQVAALEQRRPPADDSDD